MTALATSPKGTTEVDRHVGERVRALRLQCGLSQQKLAERLGVTFPQVQKYENGTNRISVSRLQQISKILAVNVASFFDGLPGDEESAEMDGASEGPSSQDLLRLWSTIRDPALRRNVFELVGSLARRGL